MNFLKTALLGAALSLGSLAAQAQTTTFNFSYSFDPAGTSTSGPLNVTGSFTGTAAGNLISNIGNVTLSINGTLFGGPFVVEAMDASFNASTSIAPVFSSDVSLANFVFVDADLANHPDAVNNGFYIANGQAFALSWNLADAGGNPLTGAENALNASLAVSAVPEPATWALMAAGAGVLVLRRRRQA